MTDKAKGLFSSIGDFLSRVNNSVTGVSALLITSVGIFYMAWEFSDRWQERTMTQTEYSKQQDNMQQAHYLKQILKKDLDSLTNTFARTNKTLIEQSIKKDSILLLILPQMSREINRTNTEVDRLNHKFNQVLSISPKNERTDFVRVLNERDSLAKVRVKNDSINQIILNEIRKANYRILMMSFLPEQGSNINYRKP